MVHGLKVKDVPDELLLRAMLHILIAMVLAPLLLFKDIPKANWARPF